MLASDSFAVNRAIDRIKLLQVHVSRGLELHKVPELLRAVMRDEAWRFARQLNGYPPEPPITSFRDFIVRPQLGGGLGAGKTEKDAVEMLQRICERHVDLVDAIAREVQREPGRPTVGDAPMTGTERSRKSRASDAIPEQCNETLDNIQGFVASEASEVHVEPPTGTSVERALLRLGEQRPDLHAQVLAGAKSAHAACVEAGFRRRTITVPVDVERAVATLRRHFSADEIAQMVRLLGDVP
jgi:hypothetical protein